MNKEEIIQEWSRTFNEFKMAINSFDEKTYNEVPFEDSWTPGQISKHVILSASGFAQILKGEVAPTERPFDQFVDRIKSIFLDFDNKMKSPDFILPPKQTYDKVAQLAEIDSIQSDSQVSIASLDLTQTCLAFELPVFGFLTRYEAIYFVIHHTQRHTHQLNKISQLLKCRISPSK